VFVCNECLTAVTALMPFLSSRKMSTIRPRNVRTMYVANKAAQTVEDKKKENRGRRRNTWQHDPETKMKETGYIWK